MQDQVDRYNNDLKSEYKDIDKLYRKHFVGVKVKSFKNAKFGAFVKCSNCACLRHLKWQLPICPAMPRHLKSQLFRINR